MSVELHARGSVKARRTALGLSRNAVAARATMGARTLSLIEDGKLHATPAIFDRIHLAIDSLTGETDQEAG